jgi:hypothetical protein
MLRDGSRQSAIESDEEHAPTWASGSVNTVGKTRSAQCPPKPRKSEARQGQARPSEAP